jgi:hypothetical protein
MTDADSVPYDFVLLGVSTPPSHDPPIDFAWVDRKDAKRLKKYKWRLSSDGYAVRDVKVDGKTQTIRMHREILDAPDDMVVDHVDGEGLNNLRINLRLATVSQNNANSAPRRRGKYKGVYRDKKSGKYRVKLTAGGKSIHVGVFEDKHEAALAYNEAALKYHGEFARLNDVPGSPTSPALWERRLKAHLNTLPSP